MTVEPLPPWFSWRHREAREGSEVVFVTTTADQGTTFDGSTVAVEAGEPWVVDYRIVVDERWRTRRAEISARSRSGLAQVVLDGDGEGHWLVDGVPVTSLEGCLDVDLEASALTNTLPVHRFLLAGSGPACGPGAESAPAVFVRALDCAVERLEQTYRRLDDGPDGPRFHYTAPVFEVSCVLSYDHTGLVVDYPGLARRAGPDR